MVAVMAMATTTEVMVAHIAHIIATPITVTHLATYVERQERHQATFMTMRVIRNVISVTQQEV